MRSRIRTSSRLYMPRIAHRVHTSQLSIISTKREHTNLPWRARASTCATSRETSTCNSSMITSQSTLACMSSATRSTKQTTTFSVAHGSKRLFRSWGSHGLVTLDWNHWSIRTCSMTNWSLWWTASLQFQSSSRWVLSWRILWPTWGSRSPRVRPGRDRD